MPTVIVPYKGLVIKKAGNSARSAIILAHGGYTPDRGCFRHGSGNTYVPFRITLVFNCSPDRLSIGKKMADAVLAPSDNREKPSWLNTILGGSIIRNYSLTYNDKFKDYEPNKHVDIVAIPPHKKAHMSDVFDAINTLNLHYQVIYSVSCRINKLDPRALLISSPMQIQP
ncbi:putative adhesin [Xenorhabdus griffiniae]|uniref:putative adhesin n=1 Tax=Xenorhabdus griffiniae TaxID=351672 RepID=UPI0030CE5226